MGTGMCSYGLAAVIRNYFKNFNNDMGKTSFIKATTAVVFGAMLYQGQ